MPALGAGEAHIWAARFDLAVSPPASLADLLSAEERARSARFRFPKDRHRSIYARGWLRRFLGGYLGRLNSAIRIETGPHGKPQIAGGEVHFNVSHSGDGVLFGFSPLGPLGVDLEFVRPVDDWESIAERYFCPSEILALRQIPAASQLEGFFRCWTRKEAYLKAAGTGLSASLKSVEVSCHPEETARIISLGGSAEAADAWALHAWEPFEKCPGCLAIPAGPLHLKAWKWEETL